MGEPRIICYSHSEYEDILKIQHAFLKSHMVPITLFTNKVPAMDFDHVILYDDSLNYSKRLAHCLSQITDEYIIFFHDMDILIKYDQSSIKKLLSLMKEQSLDRIDFQVRKLNERDTIPFEDDIILTRRPHNFVNEDLYYYNVNPSIWKTSALLDIMNKFDKGYRDIERVDTQYYVRQKFKIYKLYTPLKINAGYFNTTKLFCFLHITHYGKLLGKNNELPLWLKVIYKGILESFKITRDFND